MQNTLQQQLDISKSLLESLERMVYSFETMTGQVSSQSNVIFSLGDSMKKSEKLIKQASSKSSEISRDMEKSSTDAAVKDITKNTKNVSSTINKSLEKTERTFGSVIGKALRNNKIIESLGKKTKTINSKLKNSTTKITTSLKRKILGMKSVAFVIKASRYAVSFLQKAVGMIATVKNAFMTAGLSLAKDIPMLIFSFLKSLFSIFTSIIGAATKFFMFSLSLPFTIGQAAASIGYKIRTEIVEVIQGAGEEAKESFDLASHIGKNAAKMTNMSKGLLKTFESPRTRLSKLFGMGAQGAAKFLTETFKAVSDMGHYSEYFGSSLMGSVKSGRFLIEMQRAMGLGQKELSYYAMESFNSGRSVFDVLHNTTMSLKKASKDNDLDFVSLRKEFNTLRVNIVDFGHLSSNEIQNLVVKLRKMKVKTDDAVNVFKKFTSLEEASKASAMLFQSFEMSVDAFDLLTARDPGEMLQQFKDAMLDTGKSFKDLNRHEKALMSSITGIGENGLKSLMNYLDLGYTYDQAKKKMEKQDPTEQQTEMIKGLTSTIKLVQKTMEFKSPFDAFFKGLSKNMSFQSKLKKASIDLNKVYEDFFHLGLNLNTDDLNMMLKPISLILQKISKTLTGQRFKRTLLATTKAASDLLGGVAYDLHSKESKKVIEFEREVQLSTQQFGSNYADKIKEAKDKAYMTLEKSLDLGDKSKGMNLNKMLLKELKNKGVLTKSGDHTYNLVKNLTLEKLNSALKFMQEKYSGNAKASNKIQAILKNIRSEYFKNINLISEGAGDRIHSEVKNQNSVSSRIDSFYDSLLKAFNEGEPAFNNIVEIGGTIMGSIIKGIMLGVAAGFKIFSGASNISAQSLGIIIDDKTKQKLKSQGKSLKDFTIFDWMQMSDKERKTISQEFGKESMETASYLPNFIVFAGSFMADLSGLFIDFAMGIAGGIADVMLDYYNQSNFAMKIFIKNAAGLNIEEAYRLRSRNAGDYKEAATSKKGLNLNKLKQMSQDKEGNEKTSYIGSYLDTLRNLTENSEPGSPLNVFLTHENVKNAVSMINNYSQNSLDYDARRGQAVLEILDRAFQVNSKFPEESFLAYKKKEDMIENSQNTSSINIKGMYDKSLANANNAGASMGKISDLFSLTAEYSHNYDDLIKVIKDMEMNKSKGLYDTTVSNKNLMKNITSVRDGAFSGKNSILISGKKIVKFHGKDLIAQKPAGWLDKLFEKASEYYQDFASKINKIYLEKICEINDEKENIKAECISLKKSIINKDKEVSDEEMFELFNLSLEVINIFANRKIEVNNSKVRFES